MDLLKTSLTSVMYRLICKSGVEESNQNAYECDHDQQTHDFQRAQLFLGHQPPAEDNKDCSQQSGEHAVKFLLKDHVCFTGFVVKSKTGLYTDPGC